jgi:hypothetical protein
MKEEAIREMNLQTDKISVQLRSEFDSGSGEDRWPLATFSGGVNRISLSRRGNTTTIKIESPQAVIWSEGYRKPAVRPGRRAKIAQATPV